MCRAVAVLTLILTYAKVPKAPKAQSFAHVRRL
jgi:hypothetical protein